MPAAPVISPTPQPTLAGVINGHRFAVGNRVHRLTGPALQRPAAEGILNAHRHAWKTRQTGVLNAHRHQWKPPFPEIINSQRHRWKPWILSRPGRES